METAVFGVIGKSLLTEALTDLYAFLKETNYKEQLHKVMQDLDLDAELSIVQAILDDMHSVPETQTIKISTQQVKETIEQIHTELDSIRKELENHKNRYFYTWRSPDYAINLQNLKKYKEILRKRRELLMQVFSMPTFINLPEAKTDIRNSPELAKFKFIDLEKGKRRRMTQSWMSS